ncbi:hypothetical protein [Streptomyces sp. NPDC001980]|uniref:hypothetical protein n=1 Tax=Streptomyces sp. NPDC001980 TaxID=3157126 RepID=UPI00332FA7F1
MKKKWLYPVLGVVLILVGAGWTLQGLNVMKDSAMSGVTLWAVLGPVVALVGVVLLGAGIARGRRLGR